MYTYYAKIYDDDNIIIGQYYESVDALWDEYIQDINEQYDSPPDLDFFYYNDEKNIIDVHPYWRKNKNAENLENFIVEYESRCIDCRLRIVTLELPFEISDAIIEGSKITNDLIDINELEELKKCISKDAFIEKYFSEWSSEKLYCFTRTYFERHLFFSDIRYYYQKYPDKFMEKLKQFWLYRIDYSVLLKNMKHYNRPPTPRRCSRSRTRKSPSSPRKSNSY